ncbi:MAG: phosphotransferase family protein [Acholeplasmataceae bacterium]|jgi:thiamine kinase-like enzyme|nr:phosphotransferase family protein [Acholeplasmataceae bacterium]
MEDKIKKAAAEVFHTNIDNINIKYRLLGGMSNYTYVISYKDELYTIRLLGDGAEIFVDRVAEYHNLNEASKLGIVNETVYFNIETGVKVSKYIKGEWITKDNVKDHYEEVAELLRKVHTSNLTAYSKFDPIGRIEKYQKHSNNYNPEYEEIKKWWKDTYIKNYQDIPFTFTHGDCQRSNFVIGHDKLYLLDWEFSGSNDPLYDVSVYGQNDFNDAINLLPIYLQRTPTEEEYYRIRFYRLQQVLMWYHVALYKDDIGLSAKLKLDFKLIADNYLKEAKHHYKLLRK